MADEARGGLWDTSDLGAANWAIFYVHVEDVRAARDQALPGRGATVAIPFTDNGGIEFAHLLDPFGKSIRDLATKNLATGSSDGTDRTS